MARFSIKSYLPRSLYGRAALILLVPIVTIQLVVSSSFIQRLYEDVTHQMTQNISLELALLVDAVEAAPDLPQARQRLDELGRVLAISAKLPGDEVRQRIAFYDLSGQEIDRTLRRRFDTIEAIDLLSRRKIVTLCMGTQKGRLSISFPRRRVSASNPHQLLVLMVATAALMTLIAYMFLRNQLRPIRRLAVAAEAFGKGRVEPYSPGGASEVRSAGNAFLNMRARIERQIEQRTLMLSGVSHDLRTPLTRLKLGLSLQPESEDIRGLIRDVDEMERLISAFLDFAKDEAVEELQACDPATLVRETVRNAVRAGKPVELGEITLDGGVIKMRRLSVQRALENLINNGVRYGMQVRVSAQTLDRSLRVTVEDDGPGIPPEQREEAVKAFSRLDAARNQNKGSGVGLGLAIAADVARSHGGSLRLGASDHMGGLRADLVLPK